jgi:hypothetical protein
MRLGYKMGKRAEGPIHTSLGRCPREMVMSIVRGLKARAICFYRSGLQPFHLCLP